MRTALTFLKHRYTKTPRISLPAPEQTPTPASRVARTTFRVPYIGECRPDQLRHFSSLRKNGSTCHHEEKHQENGNGHQSNGNGHSKWADWYYRLSALAIPAGIAYAFAKGMVSEEAQTLKEKYFPPTVSGVVSNVEASDYSGLLPEKAIYKVESEIKQHRHKGTTVIVISGSPGIGKYSVAKETGQRMLEQRIAEGKNDITLWSIDSTDQTTIENGYRRLAEKMGFKESPATNMASIKSFISRELWARPGSIIIYKCAKPAKGQSFPGDDILFYRGQKSKTSVIITTGSEKILEQSHKRKVPVIDIERMASLRDIYKFATRNQGIETLTSGGELIALRQLAYDTYERNTRLLSQTVAYFSNNPNTSVQEFSSGITHNNAQEFVIKKCLSSSKRMYNGKDPDDVAKVLRIIAPENGSQKGIDIDSLYTDFSHNIGSQIGPTESIKTRVNKSCDCLIKNGLANFDHVDGKMFPVMLSSQSRFIEVVPTYHHTDNSKPYTFLALTNREESLLTDDQQRIVQ